MKLRNGRNKTIYLLALAAIVLMFNPGRAFSDTNEELNTPDALVEQFEHDFIKQLEQDVRAILDGVAGKQ